MVDREYIDRIRKEHQELVDRGLLSSADKVPTDDEYEAIKATGWLDQKYQKARNAAEHASNWYSKTAHLVDEPARPEVDRILKMAKRGMINDHEINGLMRRAAGSIYPDFEPDTSPTMRIPDHLGDQFR